MDRNRSFPLSMLNGRAPPIGIDTQWFDDSIRGLLSQTVQDLDSFITEEVTNNLFRLVNFVLRISELPFSVER